MSTESPTHTPPPHGVVCPKCLSGNSETAAFCAACGAPIGMIANTDPMQRIYAEGFTYRSAVEGPPRLIVLVGMWLLFGPMAIVAVSLIITGGREIFFTIPGSLLLLCAAIILYRVTRNYVVKLRSNGTKPS